MKNSAEKILQIEIGRGRKQPGCLTRAQRCALVRRLYGEAAGAEHYAAALAEFCRQQDLAARRLAARYYASPYYAGRTLHRLRELRREREEAARKAAAGTMAQRRRRVFAGLRKLGFRREFTSGPSAYYYHRGRRFDTLSYPLFLASAFSGSILSYGI